MDRYTDAQQATVHAAQLTSVKVRDLRSGSFDDLRIVTETGEVEALRPAHVTALRQQAQARGDVDALQVLEDEAVVFVGAHGSLLPVVFAEARPPSLSRQLARGAAPPSPRSRDERVCA